MKIEFALILLFIAFIPSAYAAIEDSTEYGSIQVDNEFYEVSSSEQTMIKAWGTVNDIHGGARLNLVVTLPSGLTDGLHTVPTSEGYFETFWMVDAESQLGQYAITASYESALLGEVTFEIKEKIFSEQELLTARQILDQNQIEIPVEEEITEEQQSESSEIKEISLYDKGLTKLNQQKYKESLLLFNLALIDEPDNLVIKTAIEKVERKIYLENKCDDVSFQSSSDYDFYSECCELNPVREIHQCKRELIDEKNKFLEEKYSNTVIDTVKQENNVVIKNNPDTSLVKKETNHTGSNILLYLIMGGIFLIIIASLYKKFKKTFIPSFVITTSHMLKQQSNEKIKWGGI